MLRSKALTLIAERATVTDESGRPVDIARRSAAPAAGDEAEAGDEDGDTAAAEAADAAEAGDEADPEDRS